MEYSYSRIMKYENCKLAYYLHYVKKFRMMPEPKESQDTLKGSAFHEFAEDYESNLTTLQVEELLNSKIDKFKVDKSLFDFDKAISVFTDFWKNFIEEKIKEGFKVFKEYEVKEKFFGKVPMLGIVDLLLAKDDELIIIDYKTPKKIDANRYKKQLVLYTDLLSSNFPKVDIYKNVSLYVFFPMAENSYNWKESFLKIPFTKDYMDNLKSNFEKIQKSIESNNWEVIDENLATIDFSCKWCNFAGSFKKGDYPGCEATRQLGIYQDRNVYFEKKE